MSKTKLRLLFPAEQTAKPISYHLVKDYDLVFNIFHAHIRPGMRGETILEVEGTDENIRRGIEFLQSQHVEVDTLTRCIVWDEDQCTHCGACTSVCPTGALSLNNEAMLVFDDAKCVACELCIPACPASVMKVNFTEE